MQMMHWYNPKTRLNEEVPAPISDAQAIELLSEHLTPMSSLKSTGAGARRNRMWWSAHPHGPGVLLGTRTGAASKLTPRRPVLQRLSLCCGRMALSVLDDGGEADSNLSMVARFSPPPLIGQPRAVNGPRAPRKA